MRESALFRSQGEINTQWVSAEVKVDEMRALMSAAPRLNHRSVTAMSRLLTRRFHIPPLLPTAPPA